jgi:hypothetical protein
MPVLVSSGSAHEAADGAGLPHGSDEQALDGVAAGPAEAGPGVAMGIDGRTLGLPGGVPVDAAAQPARARVVIRTNERSDDPMLMACMRRGAGSTRGGPRDDQVVSLDERITQRLGRLASPFGQPGSRDRHPARLVAGARSTGR